eukprot:10094712-Heterocapsa_arctica.AAC.1
MNPSEVSTGHIVSIPGCHVLLGLPFSACPPSHDLAHCPHQWPWLLSPITASRTNYPCSAPNI